MIENAPALFGRDIADVFSSTTTTTTTTTTPSTMTTTTPPNTNTPFNRLDQRERSKSEINFAKASEMIPMDLMLTGKENEMPDDSFVDQVDCGAVSSFSASSSSSSSPSSATSSSANSTSSSSSSDDSLIKRVASPKQHIVIEGRFHLDRKSDCNISNNDRIESDGSTTTSILIVNHSQSKRLQSSQQQHQSDGQIETDATQRRPLSVTESTSSSSRASSSTSGVHSESPAFSSEVDSHNARTTTSSPSSVSSPLSSASSPVQEETPSREAPEKGSPDSNGVSSQSRPDHHHMNIARRLSESLVKPSLAQPETGHRSHHMLNRYSMGVLNRVPKIPVQYTTSCYGGEAVIYNPRPRSIGRFDSYSAQINNEQSNDALKGDRKISVETSSAAQHQAQHYNTISRSDEQKHLKGQRMRDFLAHAHNNHLASLVSAPRLPYLPAHPNHISTCHPSFKSSHQQAGDFGACQRTSANMGYVQEQPIFYSSTNLNALQQQHHDRPLQYHRASLEPQRSHVLSLRDYYLSLQAPQMPRQQQQQQQNSYVQHRPYNAQQHSQLISQHQQLAVVNKSHIQSSQQQQPHSRHQNHPQNQQHQQEQESRLMVQQQQQPLVNNCQFQSRAMVAPVQSKIGMTNHQIVHRSPPRMAKIRQNQLNSVYVKQAGPVVGSPGLMVAGGGGGLVGGVVAGCGLKASSNNAFNKLSSSENSSDESDDYMNDWMESTMV